MAKVQATWNRAADVVTPDPGCHFPRVMQLLWWVLLTCRMGWLWVDGGIHCNPTLACPTGGPGSPNVIGTTRPRPPPAGQSNLQALPLLRQRFEKQQDCGYYHSTRGIATAQPPNKKKNGLGTTAHCYVCVIALRHIQCILLSAGKDVLTANSQGLRPQSGRARQARATQAGVARHLFRVWQRD